MNRKRADSILYAMKFLDEKERIPYLVRVFQSNELLGSEARFVYEIVNLYYEASIIEFEKCLENYVPNEDIAQTSESSCEFFISVFELVICKFMTIFDKPNPEVSKMYWDAIQYLYQAIRATQINSNIDSVDRWISVNFSELCEWNFLVETIRSFDPKDKTLVELDLHKLLSKGYLKRIELINGANELDAHGTTCDSPEEIKKEIGSVCYDTIDKTVIQKRADLLKKLGDLIGTEATEKWYRDAHPHYAGELPT